MSIFAGTKEINAIKVGGTNVKAVYAGDKKVWPDLVDIPSANHTYSNRVIWNYGSASSSDGNYYTETGSPVAIGTEIGDLHIMFGGHEGGYTFQDIKGFSLGNQNLKQLIGTFYQSGPPQFKVSCSMDFVDFSGAGSQRAHSMTIRSDVTYWGADFMAYAIKIPKANLPFSSSDSLSFRSVVSPGVELSISGLVPNSIVMFAATAGTTMDGSSPIVGGGMAFTTGGTSKNNRWRINGGYGYGRADSGGNFVVDFADGGRGRAWAGILVGVEA